MSKNRGRASKKNDYGRQGKEISKLVDENSLVIQAFRKFALELDDKNDRYERIIKLSRDITIESKRIIFLLLSINTDGEEKQAAILEEADTRLNNLIRNPFKSIAIELKRKDPYLYHKAFTFGFQEFIEALCLYQYIKNGSFHDWTNINNNFQYVDSDGNNFNLLFSQYDFVLGIADFTGELMRKCINALGVGNVNECFKLCNFVRSINTGFLGLIYSGNKEISRKAYTLKQSLDKMELVCYNIRIRGSEVPQHMLLNVIECDNINNEADEGFCV